MNEAVIPNGSYLLKVFYYYKFLLILFYYQGVLLPFDGHLTCRVLYLSVWELSSNSYLFPQMSQH